LFGEGQWNIIDIDEFYDSFYKTYIAFTGNPPADTFAKNVKERDSKARPYLGWSMERVYGYPQQRMENRGISIMVYLYV
jgi:hypothetical protein